MKVWLRRLVLIAFALAVAAVIVYAFLPQPIAVDVAPVGRGLLRVTVDDDGKTRIKERYAISAPLPGQVQRIKLKRGDKVEAGKTVAVVLPSYATPLDDRALAEARAKVKAATTSLESAREEYGLAQRELVRAKGAKRGVTEEDLDRAMLRERTTGLMVQYRQYELEQAEAVLKAIEVSPGEKELRPFEVRSPINGCVLDVPQESERTVPAGTELIKVGDPTDLEAEIDLLSQDAVKVRPGDKVIFEHWGGEKPLHGRLRLVEPQGFTKLSALGVEEQRVNAIIDFIEPPEQRKALKDNFRVEARIIIWESDDVVKVPSGSLFRNGNGWAAYVVANGKAQLRSVQVGRSNGLETQVLEGLNENDLVIVHPSDKITPGVAVTPR